MYDMMIFVVSCYGHDDAAAAAAAAAAAPVSLPTLSPIPPMFSCGLLQVRVLSETLWILDRPPKP